MSECVNKYFIFNNEERSCEQFDDNLLKGGKSLYEVIRIIDGKPLFLQRHLERLKNSAKLTDLNIWFSEDDLKNKIYELVRINDTKIGNIKIIFKFGETNIFLAYFVKHHYPNEDEYRNGVKTILYHGERENPNAKIINLSFREAVNKEIEEKNAYEAILVNKKGNITEGSKSNIFMIKNGKVLTAPLIDVLPGVTRGVVIELCSKIGLQVLEKNVDYMSIKDLDGLFISGTSTKILPIGRVDDIKFNSASNKVVLELMKKYDEISKEDIGNFS
ncbi:aminotransferase class IV family protein [Clostridiaceae bacterium UIB06]|uniref:Aminotransferase class IV family protein n=1 Tax=Clostridium thailandense TaxID=2794346 RepID=A0A949TWL0_9CLOT|nr:aminotransferase class IV [Clostridium thailandense]MBV7272278.1 aminotransferase class IV family protein [Clostridium thailandense]MCH5137824.1 aminotransferase class IV family protein [Clostridiaceae bacterium UIB06]